MAARSTTPAGVAMGGGIRVVITGNKKVGDQKARELEGEKNGSNCTQTSEGKDPPEKKG